ATTGTDKGDAFVAHISADGSSLLYLVYLGGGGNTEARAIAVNAAGNVYVAGETYAPDFPVRNALQPSCSLNSARACSGDAFLTKLSPEGVVIFSTYLGGSGEDGANSIALDAAGNIYLGGATTSTDFPVSRAQQANSGGNGDGFLAQIAGDGSRLYYATYLGGAAADEIRGIRLDAAGNIYVTGQTHSFDFPVANAIQTNCRADVAGKCNGEAFVTKLAAISGGGSSILFSTYLGGSGGDAGNGIALDAQGNIYVTGTTSSADFPVTNALQAAGRGKSDAFLTKLSADGTTISFSTYLGGAGTDEGDAVDVDGAGNVFVAGGTQSDDFPLMNSIQGSCRKDSNGACFENAFVAALDSTGTLLKFSSYFGGTGNQAGRGIALDLRGGVYLAGGTGSTDFPGAKPVQISQSAAGNPAALNSTAMTAVTQTRGGTYVSKIAGVASGAAGAAGGLAGPLPQAATTCAGTATIWLGGTGNWNNPASWSTGVVPNSTSTNVCIDNGNNLNSVVTLNINASVGNLTVDSGDELIVGDNQSLVVAGNISNDGLIAISAANNNTFLRIQGAVNLAGAGAVTLSTSGGGTAFINQLVANSVLTNEGSTIDGFGQIGNNGLALVNQAGGIINANAAGKGLTITGVASVTNAGTLEANGGVLQLSAATYNNLGGTITSNGSGSTVQLLNSVVIQGGTLNENGGGDLETGASNTATLDGVSQGSMTILGTYTLADNSSTIVSGTLVNSGTLQFKGAGNNTFLRANGAVTLTGGGTVTLNTTGGGTAFINQNVANSTLTNVNNLIQGTGQIGNNGLALVNLAGGTINANAATPLTVNANPLTNAGLLEATTSGTLQLNAVTCINAGGTITANGNGSTVQLANGTIIQGGLLTTTLGGMLGTAASQTATLDGSTPSGTVTNQGTYTGADNSTTLLVGTINNTGAFLIAAAGNNTFLRATGAVTLMGGGTVTLTTSGGGTAFINQSVGNSTLTNVDNSIEGKGQIGNNGLAFVNEISGVVDANVLGATLLLNANGFTNQGLMEATLGANLQLSGTVFNNLGGNITSSGPGSTVQFENSATIQGGTITSSGGGALGTAAGHTITLDGAAKGPLTIAGIYTGADNSSTILVGTIANAGTVQINAAGNNTFLKITNGVTLTGAGVVVL
ncbi:MAG: beta strand repeat-containing protein, partial [Candidatus Acidiferrales bacterium]